MVAVGVEIRMQEKAENLEPESYYCQWKLFEHI